MAPALDPARRRRLDKLLNDILHGKQKLSAQNNPHFIEALCAQPDAATCVNNIISSPAGLTAVQDSMRLDLSTKFFNGAATDVLTYLQAPTLSDIGGGSLLNQVILKIVDPPIFWNQFILAFRTGQLQDGAQRCFAWLLLHLISTASELSNPYLDLARDATIVDKISASANPETSALGEKITHFIELRTTTTTTTFHGDLLPGGRHDNDFADFRAIAILPTAEEITSKKASFLRSSSELEDPETIDTRLSIYLDGLFRLLREDMLYELKEELLAHSTKKGRRGLTIDGMTLVGIHCGPDGKRCKWGINLECTEDLPFFDKIKPTERRAHLASNGNARKFLKHQSLTCLFLDGELVAFATLNRDEDLLAKKPPILVLQLEGDISASNVLLGLKKAKSIKLIQINTAVFAFEPVLKALQDMRGMPLAPELLFWTPDDILRNPSSPPMHIISALTSNPRCDLQPLLGTPKSIILDASQSASLLSALNQKVSLIQGPPGTGKSFIGALLAKALVDYTDLTILVVCYTNHALDQFLEDLVGIGIPPTTMVRLGKANAQNEAMSLFNQTTRSRRSQADWSEIDALKARAEGLYSNLRALFEQYNTSLSNAALLDYLEFEDPSFHDAFSVPDPTSDEMTIVGRDGRALQKDYLLHQWVQGRDAGVLKQHAPVLEATDVWRMPTALRKAKVAGWKKAIMAEQVEQFVTIAREYNETQTALARKFTANTVAVLQSKRIIGCTTTAAAKYTESIQAASPGVLLVEEAGEILESHVLTALGEATDQLILIGDHQQLRPKVNNYQLTVEKGDGYELNRSLFERLVLKGYPHQTLTQQHRMRPEISDLVRQLTYPHLIDAASTKNRPSIRGLRDVIVFINHACPEDEIAQLSDRRDMGSPSSKQNTYEVEMVLKIVRYLGQQGYGTDKLVILTPYLGQLSLLKTTLAKETDPILNDLDSNELIRAGVIAPGSSKTHNRPLRLATIDNYQGEESDIVVVSLTRSNPNHDIGFMFSPERLNVLLSRARDCLIMVGNAETFQHARKGKELWTKLISMLQEHGHMYSGLPVKCERHPDRIATLSRPSEFETECPDGGCSEPCGTLLSCGIHQCPSRCHHILDHSKLPCRHPIKWTCEKGHTQSRQCRLHDPTNPNSCNKCANDAKKARAKLERDADELERKQKLDAEQLAHDERIAEVNAKIAREEQAMQDMRLVEQRAQALKQKEKDLQDTAARARQQPTLYQTFVASSPNNDSSGSGASPPTPKTSSPASSQPPIRNVAPRPAANPPTGAPNSESEEEWERQKRIEGASNTAIDEIMGMIGLEDVKAQVLKIKHKIDVVKRQHAQLNDERFNTVFQGNPGTGKTTVARHFIKFLESTGVLPGSAFIETTGSRLSNEGVAGIKAHIATVEAAGGGAIFIDEAYQLTSEYGSGGSAGKQVLDFLLAEMENKVGTIVFVFAGYKKELESFFEHNPGLASRVPYNLHFTDYTDEELLSILQQLISKKFRGTMKFEDGPRGLYSRIVIRRLGRGRGQAGFGNARAVHNLFARIHERQASRLQKERKEGWTTDDFLLTKEDLIGPDPSLASRESVAWKKLQALIGLDSVKKSVRSLMETLISNYKRELKELNPILVSLNRVFLGSPGTGKTTVAKLYGQILVDLGLLSRGEVVVKNPSDFVGAYIGHSEKNTKAILATTIGKVLVIDEAYMLFSGGKHGIGNESDSFKTAVIDTLVAEIQSVPGEDRAVLLLGYEDKMREMFQNVNPGLSRRFAIEDAFHFEDFTEPQLRDVLDLKLKEQDLGATDAAKLVALEVLDRARRRPNFGNAGEVENLLRHAKTHHVGRHAGLPEQERPVHMIFEPRDFDADFDRSAHASDNLDNLFRDMVGCDHIKEKLGAYQQIAVVTKERGMDPRKLIPTNFVFKGPPGTGKTTIARKMGQVYFDMGFLASKEVHECSASDLVGQYIGHTGPKTKQLFEKALGKVLFIDEAYRLGEGRFAQEAIDELVGILTNPSFQSKLVVVLAGYDQDMNNLMAVNTGLSSRFPEEIIFTNMDPDACLEVLQAELQKATIVQKELSDKGSSEYTEMREIVRKLSKLPGWGNARDMQTLATQMASAALAGLAKLRKMFWKDTQPTLSARDAIQCMKNMLEERRSRATNLKPQNSTHQQYLPTATPLTSMATAFPPAQTSMSTAQPSKSTVTEPPGNPPSPKAVHPQAASSVPRDHGVTDDVWEQLQLDKETAKNRSRILEEGIQNATRELDVAAQQAKVHLQGNSSSVDATYRLQVQKLVEERERRRKELERKRQEAEKERQREIAAQAALKRMGVCVQGYAWVKQAGGYRCRGGSHTIRDDQLHV
ncbi:P-loop containing nucleoside triphosphate hydrolase protein [Mycena filopes]|nr:P-loop containing nucleoside triphosphate hydrolase protein [Mycena filopes]